MAAATLTVDELATVFSDVTPIPQDDGPNAVCTIDYTEDFRKAHDYMRAILRADERSDRALQLTALCLKFNPANYTVWHFRRRCLLENLPLTPERVDQDMQLASRLGGDNPKNYQIWHHRRALLETLGLQPDSARKELAYVATVLDEDAKNYHAWTHRQWIIQTVDCDELWNEEMEFVHALIIKDPRNNSAWNERWFAVHRGLHQQPLSSQELRRKEADYAIEGARIDPYNESPWRYLIGILREEPSLMQEYEPKAAGLRQVLSDAGRDPDGCANLTSARIDMLETMGDKDSLGLAVAMADDLGAKHDLIRKKYWQLRASEMRLSLTK